MIIIKIVFSIILWTFPWPIRRLFLNKIAGYKISTKARIGFSIIIPDQLEMHNYSRIGHLSVCKGLKTLKLGEYSRIGNLNWISGYPIKNTLSFYHRKTREPSLIIGEHSAITHRHLIDCTDKIEIGSFTTIAGYHSQFLTHSIDILHAMQDCEPISIGSYCLLGTSCVLLPGAALGDYSVLGANSLLNKGFNDQYILFGGVPAVMVKELPKDAQYFNRKTGFIN